MEWITSIAPLGQILHKTTLYQKIFHYNYFEADILQLLKLYSFKFKLTN